MDIFVPVGKQELQIACHLCKRPISKLFYLWQDEICEVCWRKINQENGSDWNPNDNL